MPAPACPRANPKLNKGLSRLRQPVTRGIVQEWPDAKFQSERIILEEQTQIAISGLASLSSLLSMAYFAGRFSEKITTLENKVTLQAEAKLVDRDFEALKDNISKQFTHVSLQLEDVKKELHNVRTELRHSTTRS